MLLTYAKEFAYRIKLLTQFAYEKQICWIADRICLGESRFASSAKILLICWFAELLTELVFIHDCVEFSYERQICWIADTICFHIAPSKNLLKIFAHSRNLLTEFARSIEKLLTMKNLAGSDGSTRWLNVSYQANRSTAGAHHSTVSVVTAGTCWAGPSRAVLGGPIVLFIVPGMYLVGRVPTYYR